jgi:hypothetical protein
MAIQGVKTSNAVSIENKIAACRLACVEAASLICVGISTNCRYICFERCFGRCSGICREVAVVAIVYEFVIEALFNVFSEPF